jgi:hypothetical protein
MFDIRMMIASYSFLFSANSLTRIWWRHCVMKAWQKEWQVNTVACQGIFHRAISAALLVFLVSLHERWRTAAPSRFSLTFFTNERSRIAALRPFFSLTRKVVSNFGLLFSRGKRLGKEIYI